MKREPTLQPRFRYSVDLQIQTYTDPVPLIYGKLATWIYGYFYSVRFAVHSIRTVPLYLLYV